MITTITNTTSAPQATYLNFSNNPPKKSRLSAHWFLADDGKLVCQWLVD